MNRTLVMMLATALLSAATLAGCSDSNSSDAVVRKASGTVLSVLNGAVQAGRDFSVFDLKNFDAANPTPVFSGTSDSNGMFEFELKGVEFSFVQFSPDEASAEPRTAGLVLLRDDLDVEKNLRDFTDIACEAGLTAVLTGAITVEQLTVERIANLENAAASLLDSETVDFADPAQVTAAAQRVREATDDGATPATFPAL